MLESQCSGSVLQFYQKETLTLMFSSEYYELFLRAHILKSICERLLLIL